MGRHRTVITDIIPQAFALMRWVLASASEGKTSHVLSQGKAIHTNTDDPNLRIRSTDALPCINLRRLKRDPSHGSEDGAQQTNLSLWQQCSLVLLTLGHW